MNNIKLLDCTLRDGGYYNNWNFSKELIQDYLDAMESIKVDYIEIGFRFIKNNDFKGACAFSTDSYISSLNIPQPLKNKIGIMVNGGDILSQGNSERNIYKLLGSLFAPKIESPVSLVRIACHIDEFEPCLPAVTWLKSQGYKVGFNLMQIHNVDNTKIAELLKLANPYPIDVLYFADSMGCLDRRQISSIVDIFKRNWNGDIGIHAHDSMGKAVNNSMQALSDGVNWVDSTVTGMGRGPGNAQTEYIAIEMDRYHKYSTDKTKLFRLISNHFKPLKEKFGWGLNPYYFLAGKYNIHPTYIQEMISDKRYNEEDIVSVIDYLKEQGASKFYPNTLEAARHFYSNNGKGNWYPVDSIKNNDVLVLGTGPGVVSHRAMIEAFIEKNKPFVIALNSSKQK